MPALLVSIIMLQNHVAVAQAANVSDSHRAIFDSVIHKLEANTVSKYDATFINKCFDCDFSRRFDYQVAMLRMPSDTVWGNYFFYSCIYNGVQHYKYYDGERLYVIDTAARKKTVFNPKANQLSPVNNSVDGNIVLFGAFLFNPETMKKVFYSPKEGITRYDTIINNTPYLVQRNNFEDSDEYTDQYRMIFVNRKTYNIDRIFSSVTYLHSQVEVQDMHYQNISFDNNPGGDFHMQFEQASKGFTEEIYQVRKPDTLSLGSTIPSFKGRLYENNVAVSLPENNKVTLYDFWYTACMPCVQTIPAINRLYEKYKGQVNFYGVNPIKEDVSTPRRISDFQQRTPIRYPIVLTEQAAIKALKVVAFPTLYIVDKNGQLVFKKIGYNEEEDLYDILDKEIGALLNNK